MEWYLIFEDRRGTWDYRVNPTFYSAGSKIDYEDEDEFDLVALLHPFIFLHGYGAGFVGGLSRIGIKGWVGQLIRFKVVHRDEKLPALHRGRDKGGRGNLGSPRLDAHGCVCFDAEPFRVVGMDFDIA